LGAVTHDPARVLRDHVLEPLREALSAPGGRLLVVGDAAAAAGLAGAGTQYDAAWVGLERTDGVDAEGLGRDLGRALRPGARLACVVPGSWPLPATLARALRATGEGQGALRARVEGRPTERVSLAEWRRVLDPWFTRPRVRGFGVLVPPSASWQALQPLVLDALAAAEQVVAGWPIARALGERVLLEAVRR
jgi:hypothetical protein